MLNATFYHSYSKCDWIIPSVTWSSSRCKGFVSGSHFLWRFRGHIVFVLSICLSVCLSVKKTHFNLDYNFWTFRDSAFVFHMCIACDSTFPSVPNILTVTFDLHFENLNLDNNFWTIKDGAFIFHMCIPCDKTFPSVPNLLTMTFDLFVCLWHKTLTLIISFEL